MMESPGPGAADPTVGSIVWVRRRNGSWWPGKILGPEELDVTHLMSPRSGTPVKLLGREDASVDWYNLEKSKRVKAFRCGDFDDCIERVESSQGLPIRKREKYARREDAILHALELEKDLLIKQGKSAPDKVRNKLKGLSKELVIYGTPDFGNGKLESFENSRSNHVSRTIYLQKEEDYQPSAEDDHMEVAPRMRGLQDFGLRTSSSKLKVASSGALDSSMKPIACSISPSSSGDFCMEQANDTRGKEQIGGATGVRRTRYMFSPAESSDALGFRDSLLSQMQMLPLSLADGDSNLYQQSIMEANPSEFHEDAESESSDSDSDSSETEEDTDDDLAMLSGFVRGSEAGEDAFRRRAVEDESTSSEYPDESSLSGETSNLYPHAPVFTNERVSKWQLKGKRNIRSLTRSLMDKADAGYYNGSEHGKYFEKKTNNFRNTSGYDLDFHGIDELSDGTDEVDTDEKSLIVHGVGHRNGGYSHLIRMASKSPSSLSYDLLDWGDDPWEGHVAKKQHLDDNFWRFESASQYFDGKMGCRLIDADLDVQSSYEKQPVPIVSLMSKLDGRAIIGHPIQIEVLQEGSSENIETTYHDKPFILPPAWRTARRSNSRVPRPHPASSVEAYEAADEGKRPPLKNQSSAKKRRFRVPRPAADRSHPKKLQKKTSGSLSQKTRALSAIGAEYSHGMRPTRDRLNKPESTGPPTVACIPVKLVFSRLLEKINRPPSKAVTKAVLPSNAIRDAS